MVSHTNVKQIHTLQYNGVLLRSTVEYHLITCSIFHICTLPNFINYSFTYYDGSYTLISTQEQHGIDQSK